jgi:hypothetical protein
MTDCLYRLHHVQPAKRRADRAQRLVKALKHIAQTCSFKMNPSQSPKKGERAEGRAAKGMDAGLAATQPGPECMMTACFVCSPLPPQTTSSKDLSVQLLAIGWYHIRR